MNQPELGKKIAELRKSKGITQEELAQQCHIHVRTLQRIENGEVHPRNYTLTQIFASLGFKLKQRKDLSLLIRSISSYFSRIVSCNFEDIPAQELAGTYIRYAWIAAILYFMGGFADAGLGYLRSRHQIFLAGTVFYILTKLFLVISSAFYLSGFVVIGSKLKNHLLVISSLMIFFGITLFSVYDILSLFYNAIEKQTIDGGRAITFGILEILYGTAFLRLRKSFGKPALLAGILNIAEGLFFLTLIFWFLGIIVNIPAEIFEIILLYKAYKSPGLMNPANEKEIV